jgi:hypothetical protein
MQQTPGKSLMPSLHGKKTGAPNPQRALAQPLPRWLAPATFKYVWPRARMLHALVPPYVPPGRMLSGQCQHTTHPVAREDAPGNQQPLFFSIRIVSCTHRRKKALALCLTPGHPGVVLMATVWLSLASLSKLHPLHPHGQPNSVIGRGSSLRELLSHTHTTLQSTETLLSKGNPLLWHGANGYWRES